MICAISSATTLSVVFLASDEACEQEVVGQKPTYNNRHPPLRKINKCKMIMITHNTKNCADGKAVDAARPRHSLFLSPMSGCAATCAASVNERRTIWCEDTYHAGVKTRIHMRSERAHGAQPPTSTCTALQHTTTCTSLCPFTSLQGCYTAGVHGIP